MHVHVCVSVVKVPVEAGEGTGTPGAIAVGGCELPDLGARS